MPVASPRPASGPGPKQWCPGAAAAAREGDVPG